jgi:hypothetical protein
MRNEIRVIYTADKVLLALENHLNVSSFDQEFIDIIGEWLVERAEVTIDLDERIDETSLFIILRDLLFSFLNNRDAVESYQYCEDYEDYEDDEDYED